MNELKNFASYNMFNFKHYLDKNNKRDLLMTICELRNIKILNINNMECISNIQEDDMLYSSYFITDTYTNKTRIIFNNTKLINIYDINGTQIKSLKLSELNYIYNRYLL